MQIRMPNLHYGRELGLLRSVTVVDEATRKCHEPTGLEFASATE